MMSVAINEGMQKGVPVVIVSSANRALPLLARFRTYRCVAPLGDQIG